MYRIPKRSRYDSGVARRGRHRYSASRPHAAALVRAEKRNIESESA